MEIKIIPASEDVKRAYRRSAEKEDAITPFRLTVNSKTETVTRKYHTKEAALEAYREAGGNKKMLIDSSVKPIKFIGYYCPHK